MTIISSKKKFSIVFCLCPLLMDVPSRSRAYIKLTRPRKICRQRQKASNVFNVNNYSGDCNKSWRVVCFLFLVSGLDKVRKYCTFASFCSVRTWFRSCMPVSSDFLWRGKPINTGAIVCLYLFIIYTAVLV